MTKNFIINSSNIEIYRILRFNQSFHSWADSYSDSASGAGASDPGTGPSNIVLSYSLVISPFLSVSA